MLITFIKSSTTLVRQFLGKFPDEKSSLFTPTMLSKKNFSFFFVKYFKLQNTEKCFIFNENRKDKILCKICRIINIQTIGKKKTTKFLEKLEVVMNYSRNFVERYTCVQSLYRMMSYGIPKVKVL